jgi:hypothetical protein
MSFRIKESCLQKQKIKHARMTCRSTANKELSQILEEE